MNNLKIEIDEVNYQHSDKMPVLDYLFQKNSFPLQMPLSTRSNQSGRVNMDNFLTKD